jgi:hypothetical protein
MVLARERPQSDRDQLLRYGASRARKAQKRQRERARYAERKRRETGNPNIKIALRRSRRQAREVQYVSKQAGSAREDQPPAERTLPSSAKAEAR